VRGLRWPVVDGKETSGASSRDTTLRQEGRGIQLLRPLLKALPTGNLDDVTDPKPTSLAGKAKIFFRPYAAPVEQTDANFDLWLCTGRILEHWHTGSMTRRVPELHRTAPTAVMYMHADDAAKRGLKRNDVAWIESRRGKVKSSSRPRPQTDAQGSVFVAFFDEAVFINKLVIDASDPISREPDYRRRKSAVRVSKA
jgi:nitrate reductase NapA